MNQLANQQKAERNAAVLQATVNQIINKAANLNKYAFEVARDISTIKEQGLWRFEDSTQPYKSFEQWYEYSGIPVKWETARQWIRIYKELIEEQGLTTIELADIDFYKLRLVAQVAKQHPEQLPEAIEQARKLSYRDLLLAIHQNGTEISVCTHKDLEEITMYRCVVCKQTFRNPPTDQPKEAVWVAIDELMSEFMHKTELKELGESVQMSRRYASLLLKKYPRQVISECLDDLLADKFWKDKLCKISQLYRQMPTFVRDSEPVEGEVSNLPTLT